QKSTCQALTGANRTARSGRSSLKIFLTYKATAATKIIIHQNNIKHNSLKYKHNIKFKTKKEN
ncbi:MAG: hypothetical protein UHM56_08060, partial [Phascolarctobacterium sp.]|nr:hypothetical protein [Phascolarctobacterium sp.]